MAIVHTSFDPDTTELVLRSKRKRVPMFNCIAVGGEEILRTLTASESWFFWGMSQSRDLNTNLVKFSRKDCPDEKLNTFPKVMKSLEDKKLIQRRQQNVYLINPNIVLPSFDEYEKVCSMWAEK